MGMGVVVDIPGIVSVVHCDKMDKMFYFLVLGNIGTGDVQIYLLEESDVIIVR